MPRSDHPRRDIPTIRTPDDYSYTTTITHHHTHHVSRDTIRYDATLHHISNQASPRRKPRRRRIHAASFDSQADNTRPTRNAVPSTPFHCRVRASIDQPCRRPLPTSSTHPLPALIIVWMRVRPCLASLPLTFCTSTPYLGAIRRHPRAQVRTDTCTTRSPVPCLHRRRLRHA